MEDSGESPSRGFHGAWAVRPLEMPDGRRSIPIGSALLPFSGATSGGILQSGVLEISAALHTDTRVCRDIRLSGIAMPTRSPLIASLVPEPAEHVSNHTRLRRTAGRRTRPDCCTGPP